MPKKLDAQKIEAALREAAHTATTGSLAARSGRVLGAAAARTVAASTLSQKRSAKRK